MRLQKMILGMVIMLFYGVAHAEDARHYIAIANESYDADGVDGQSYRYGYDFSNMFSLELDYSDATGSGLSGLGNITTVDNITSVMMKFNKRYEKVTAYFTLGATQLTGTEDLTGYAYGVGLELYGSKNTAVVLGWTKRIVAEDSANNTVELTTTTVGLVHHFDWAKSVSRY